MDLSYRKFDSLDFEDDILHDLSTRSDNEQSFESSDFCNKWPSNNSSSAYEIITFDLDQNGQKQTKQRKYKPRAVRHDIRRSYTDMFTKVINSMDFRLIYGFLDTYFTRDFTQENRKYNISTKEQLNTSMDGIIENAIFWYNSTQTTPDAAISMTDTKIHMTKEPHSCQIISNFMFSATQIHDMNTDAYSLTTTERIIRQELTQNGSTDSETDIDKDDSLRNKRKPSSDSSNPHFNHSSTSSTLDRIVSSLEDVAKETESRKLLDKPVKTNSVGRMTMHTDEMNFITKVVFEITFVETMCKRGTGQYTSSCKSH
jgi:hypothetical protein